MKNIIYSIILLALISCGDNKENKTDETTPKDSVVIDEKSTGEFGEKISEQGAVSVEEMRKLMADGKEKEVTIKGKIVEVCQQKGCWIHLEVEKGEPLMVTFKDYGFFLPKNSSGNEAIMKGIASVKTISVDDQKHYASDEGKSKEEIAAIVEPKTDIVFEAAGVIVR